MDASTRVARRNPQQTPSELVRLLLAMGDLEGIRPGARKQDRNRLFYHRGGISERSGVPEDARLPPPHLRRHLGDRLFTGRTSARREYTHFSSRAAADLHRAGVAIKQEQRGEAGKGAVSGAQGGAS